MWIEAPEDRSLPAALAGPLNSVLLRLGRSAAASELAKKARRSLTGFVRAMKGSDEDITFSIDLDGEEGVADSGDLDTDLTALLQVAGEAARARQTVLVLFIDEMQCVDRQAQRTHHGPAPRRPTALIGSRLPQLIGNVAAARSYAERMFSSPEIVPCPATPANRLGVAYQPDALDES